MSAESFLLVTDTPSIKQFVFGTDALAEIRGASALLDRLNQQDTKTYLQQRLNGSGGRVRKIYANGGSGQFVIDGCSAEDVRSAIMSLNAHYREKTGGEVKLAFGLSPLGSNRSYRQAVWAAHFQMRSQREMAWVSRSTPLLPFVMECKSASHLAASSRMHWGGEALLLSDASCRKRAASRRARESGVWAQWMSHLQAGGSWPEDEAWDRLRCNEFTQIGSRTVRNGYIGLIYADGNAMGRLVQELSSPEVCREFSKIVDSSVREACFTALDSVCRREIAAIRESAESGKPLTPLPADILLLGGDDLLVLLPADRSLPFALEVTEQFERLTRDKIAALSGETAVFFRERVQDGGLTISCGVAIGRANYPFYLLLDLAEELLKNAKRAGSESREVRGRYLGELWTPEPLASNDVATAQKTSQYSAPAYIDFHVVAGASSHELNELRQRDYFTGKHPSSREGGEQRESVSPGRACRTARPLSRKQLGQLREGVQNLRQGQFPRSKLHDLLTAALNPSPVQAQRLVREVFSRCQTRQRQALWEAVRLLCPEGWRLDFPWYYGTSQPADERMTAVADLAEAFDLFPRKEDA